ncbi:Rieske family ferredoxin [Paenibacillus psychroresistens]|uniref:Rieske family ferredoxin n=1 Tax=Paenibacillus psychroresistens TaxID=1778678 RepID=A0A6B8RJ86_9BACL|nr:MocE family 2Fe-2S type ferredoxin [Paenibacillus psychroresistens]QGQ96109.1 Rieske family ferredoxin [Paenibacillus psychroresistens]
MSTENWIEACTSEDVEVEDVIRFDHGDRTFAIYRTEKGDYYASDGYCTHERFHLSKGLVIGNIIECPKHNGRFDIPTGKAKKVPVCIDLRTYPVKLEGGKVFINVE